MIKTNISIPEKHKNRVKELGNEDQANAVIKSIEQTIGLYDCVLIHLSKAYILSQKTVTQHFNSIKNSSFWGITQNALYDAGILYICGLLDSRKNIQHKNIKKLIQHVGFLPKKPENIPQLHNDVEKIFNRIKTYRDTKVSHPEFDKDAPIYWHDPLVIMVYLRQYIIDFYQSFFNCDYTSIETIQQRAKNECLSICTDIGVPHLSSAILKDSTEYFDKVDKKYKLNY